MATGVKALDNLLALQQATQGVQNQPEIGGGLINIPIGRTERQAAAQGHLAEQLQLQAENQALDIFESTGVGGLVEGQQQDSLLSLLSQDPSAGMQVIGNIQGQQPRPLTEAQRLSNEQGALNLAQDQQMGPIQQQAAEVALEQAQVDLAQSQRDAAIQAGIPIPPAQVPEKVPIMNPFTGLPMNADLTGTAYQKQSAAVDSLQRGLINVNEMTDSIRQTGTNLLGTADGRRQKNKHNAIILYANQAREAGVPSGTELELQAAGLADPTTTGANLSSLGRAMTPANIALLGQQRSAMVAGYDDYALELSRSILDSLRLNPLLNVDVDLIHPSAWANDDEREYYRHNSGQRLLDQQ